MTKSHLPTCIQLHLHSIYLKKIRNKFNNSYPQFRLILGLRYTFQSIQTIVTMQGW